VRKTNILKSRLPTKTRMPSDGHDLGFLSRHAALTRTRTHNHWHHSHQTLVCLKDSSYLRVAPGGFVLLLHLHEMWNKNMIQMNTFYFVTDKRVQQDDSDQDDKE